MLPILTHDDVAKTKITQHDFSSLGIFYNVELHLTPKAKQKLVRACANQKNDYRLLAIFVNGRYRSLACFRKGQVDKFVPWVGLLSSEAEAKRIVAACR